MDSDALMDFYESEHSCGIQRPSDKATQGTPTTGFELEYPRSVQLWRKLKEAPPRFSRGQIDPIRDTVRLPCFFPSTHPANTDFCGRENVLALLAIELLPLKNIATTSRTAPRQFALCGFGGIGKTEIAREFAWRHKSSFDAVFWVMADETANLDHGYQQFSLALGLEDESECKSQAVSREVVKEWLSNPRKRLSGSNEFDQADQGTPEASWLLIFDNADDPMILADYWPKGRGSILITSRDPLAKTMFTTRPSGLDLGPLTQEDSLSLFRRLTINFTEPEDNKARQIFDAFGGVPLAISQMASIIRQKHITWPEFLELWTDDEERANLYETKFDTNLVTYRHCLATVWEFEKLKPHARQLLELISAISSLDPNIIIREDVLIKALMEIPLEGLQFKKSSYFDARADLLQSSLVQRDENQHQIFVHRIIQDVVLATVDAPKKRSLLGSSCTGQA